jgi:ABC-type multidrug transport system fused ATPase/permease subunit
LAVRFDHVQRMPAAFFTRTQIGALISPLNNHVIGAQRALTGALGSVVSYVVPLVSTVIAMAVLQWPLSYGLVVSLSALQTRHSTTPAQIGTPLSTGEGGRGRRSLRCGSRLRDFSEEPVIGRCERCDQGERRPVRRAQLAERDGKVDVRLDVFPEQLHTFQMAAGRPWRPMTPFAGSRDWAVPDWG